MDTLLAEKSVGITDLKKNPSAVIRDAGDDAVVILHHNKPTAYLVPARVYEAMLDVLDDVSLSALVKERLAQSDEAVEVSIETLERNARAKISA